MKRKLNSKSSIYSFLKESGVLESGTPEEIKNARHQYWKEYKRKWRVQKRKSDSEFAIYLNDEELNEISAEAKRHKLSRSKFIKQACIAYINNTFIVPDSKEVKRIAQQLSMTFNSIQELTAENKIDFKFGKSILEAIYKLEREILPALHNPKSLEALIKEHILKNPKNKNSIVEFINSI